MSKFGMAINLHRCIGCRTCTVSCKMENQVADGIARMHVLNSDGTDLGSEDRPTGTYPDLVLEWRPVPCQHCDNPPCVEVCPAGATGKREDGLVLVDIEACIGCGMCVEACPYGARAMDEEAKKADKCTGCAHRLDGGLDTTMCQMCCPNRAIVAGDLDDASSEVARIVAEQQNEKYLEDKGTGPNVYYWYSVTKS